ncbi:MAG: hypothetical protein ACI4C1_02150 [Lachnospiraceae bacterium]
MKREKVIWWLECFLISAVILSIFATRTSPLYSILKGDFAKNTAADAMLTAKYWLQGMIPYRDLFVVENPFYLLIQLLGWVLGGRIGIFLLEICNLTIFLIWLEKIFALFASGNQAKVFSLLSLIPYIAFCAGGDSDVEWCLGLLGVGLYLLLDAIVHNTFSPKKWFVLGCISAAIGLIQPLSGAMLYGGILVQPFAASKTDERKKHWKSVVCFLIGLAIPLVLVVCYFRAMGAGYDLWIAVVFQPFIEKYFDFDNELLIFHRKIKCCISLPLFLLGLHKMFRAFRNKDEHEMQIGKSFTGMAVVAWLLQMLNDSSWCNFLAVIPAMLLALLVWFNGWKEKKKVKWLGIVLEAVFFLVFCSASFRDYVYYLCDDTEEAMYEFCEDLKDYRAQFDACRMLVINTDSSLLLYLDEPPAVKYFTKQTEIVKYNPYAREEILSYTQNVDQFDMMLNTEYRYVGQYFQYFYLVKVYEMPRYDIGIYMPYDEEDNGCATVSTWVRNS